MKRKIIIYGFSKILKYKWKQNAHISSKITVSDQDTLAVNSHLGQ